MASIERAFASKDTQLNMLTALMDGDFPGGRLMFQPDPEDVAGGVYVAIMRRSAVRTFPGSYAELEGEYRHPVNLLGRHRCFKMIASSALPKISSTELQHD